MPPDEERSKAEQIDRMLIDTMRDMSKQLGMTVLEISQNTTEQLVRYREDVHRAIMGIQRRIVDLEVRMDGDGQARKTRQEQLDAVLDSIRRHQRVRMMIEMILIAAAVAYYVGSR